MNLADLADILITLINFAEKGLCKIRTRYNRTETQKRILSTCVRLFIEQGYSNTSPKQIFKEADVSAGTFYHLYKSKGGVLNELIDFMFDNQFDIADQVIGSSAKPMMLYAVETAIQLALAEINENIRDIYVQVYTQQDTVDMIQEKTAKELYKLFGSYIPEYSQSDFYEMEIGTAAIMRGFMAHPCDMYFTLERKIARFLSINLSIFKVPESEQQEVFEYMSKLDIRDIAMRVMHELFESLAMKFDFKLSEQG